MKNWDRDRRWNPVIVLGLAGCSARRPPNGDGRCRHPLVAGFSHRRGQSGRAIDPSPDLGESSCRPGGVRVTITP
jgi:hypothetical protein